MISIFGWLVNWYQVYHVILFPFTNSENSLVLFQISAISALFKGILKINTTGPMFSLLILSVP